MIKEYKPLLSIKMFDNTELITDKAIDTVLSLLNSGVKFVKIDGQVVNVADIKRVTPFTGWDIRQAIMQEKDLQKKEVMQYWYETRKKENKQTNSLEHLLKICEAHAWTTI